MRIIILAAGQDIMLDGMVKCLIRHPGDGRTVLDYVAEAADGMPVTVVVGYRAVEIIHLYPHFDYVINKDWAITNNAYSLALALDGSPCIVTSGDIFVNRKTFSLLADDGGDHALASKRENRGVNAINAEMKGDRICSTYKGPLQNPADVELLGIFSLTSPELLALWKKQCLEHSNLFCGQTLPLGPELDAITPRFLGPGCMHHEINTVADYLRLVHACNTPKN